VSLIAKRETFTVAPEGDHSRLDSYLASILPNQSRSQIQKLIRAGLVTVDGDAVKTGYLLRAGQTIALEPMPETPSRPQPENIPLEILYLDPHLAVINKPAGLVCHAGAGIRSATLVNALLYHIGDIDTGDPIRPGIVHRLDKRTSGLLVVARTAAAHRTIARQFKNREVRKEYLALTYGLPQPAAGTLDWPLGRDPKDRKKISVRGRRRRSAITHYTLERQYGPFSLLRVRIATGRTHQIRVHLSHFGHPVVGDRVYGRNQEHVLADSRLRAAVSAFDRYLLHACLLEFRHPVTGEKVSFASELPPEFAGFLDFAKGISG